MAEKKHYLCKMTNWLAKVARSVQKAFLFFGKASKKSWKDFWVAIQVLLWFTIIMSVIFYYVEHRAQPEEYNNWFKAFIWSVTRYVGDAGSFAGAGPITMVGRLIDFLLNVMKILIYSVPAGLLAKYYVKEMEKDQRKEVIKRSRLLMRNSFRRVQDKSSLCRVPPRYVSVATLKVKKHLKEEDILDVVKENKEFRMRNLATSQTAVEHPQDRIVVEMIPSEDRTVDGFNIEQTVYGIKIDRKSNVTIVAPTAATECSIGHFAYYVAQFGGFNYVSREYVDEVDNPISYYLGNGEELNLQIFRDDILKLSYGQMSHWNVFLIAANDLHNTQFHFINKFKEGDKVSETTLNPKKFMCLFEDFSKVMEENYHLHCDNNITYRPVREKNISVTTGGGLKNNAFTIRISYRVITWTESWVTIAMDIAKTIKAVMEMPVRHSLVERKEWKSEGYGYGNNQ